MRRVEALMPDNLPTSNIRYGKVSVTNVSGLTGTIPRSIKTRKQFLNPL